jgi:hypothetical protein
MTTISVAGKAAYYRDRIVYRTIPATVDAVLMVSPTSGQVYRIGIDGSCDCPAGKAGRLCYHVVALEQQYGSVENAISDLTRCELAAHLAVLEAAEKQAEAQKPAPKPVCDCCQMGEIPCPDCGWMMPKPEQPKPERPAISAKTREMDWM